MRCLRILLGIFAACTAFGVFLPASSAAVDQCPNPLPNRAGLALPHCVMTSHFEVWYTSDTTNADYTTFTKASDLATIFERAYITETGFGFPAPADDGDGRTDVYITTLQAPAVGIAVPDNPAGPTSSGYIGIDPSQIGADTEVHVAAHELFHLIQFSAWVPQAKTDSWLFEGSAEWMGAKVDGFQASDIETIGPSDMPLDCRENINISTYQMCNEDAYVEGGYSRWPFFQYLAQRFGVTFIEDVLARGAAGATAIGAVQGAIAARGSTIGDVFNDWSVTQMTGYGIPLLDAVRPTPYATVQTGVTSANNLASVKVNVDHLSTRYVKLLRGNGDMSAPCFNASLTVAVTIPAGTLSKPTLYWDGPNSSPVPLTINGSSASTTINSWDTCTWAANEAFLSLPNASTSANSADFTVNVSLGVHSDTPASATAAPAQASTWGSIVSVPQTELPPTITVFGPELLTLSSTDKQIRVIVESSGNGSLQATIGSTSLGSGVLQTGNNDVRFTLPPSLLLTLRRSADVSNVLTLTPVAASGGAQGQPVTRKVLIKGVTPVKKPTAPKPKPKPKSKGHK